MQMKIEKDDIYFYKGGRCIGRILRRKREPYRGTSKGNCNKVKSTRPGAMPGR